jgi:hypothetical protein
LAPAQVPRDPVRALSRGRRAARLLALGLLLALASCERRRAWADGTPRFEGALTPLGGERTGEWTFRYPDGSLREQGRYEDGRRVGTWRQWWPEGTLLSEGERRPAAEHPGSPREGVWSFWHRGGTLAARGAYRAGLREGEWVFHAEDGALDEQRSGLYREGRRAE